MDTNFKKDDFVLCNYYTGVQFIGRITKFISSNEVELEICEEIYPEKIYKKDYININTKLLVPLLEVNDFKTFLNEK